MNMSSNSSRETLTAGIYTRLCSAVGTAYSDRCLEVFMSGSLDIPHPGFDYEGPLAFANAWALYNWPRKLVAAGSDTRGNALSTLREDERLNAVTNQFIRRGMRWGFPPDLEAIIVKAQRYIYACLGDFSWNSALKLCKWGNGAANGLKRRVAHPNQKCSIPSPTITLDCVPLWEAFLRLSGGSWPQSEYTVVPGNRVTFVAKTWKTDRPIAMEPVINGFFQQGVGRLIRRRLKAVGIDLRNQGVNQEWAALAHGLELSTLDLESASNSVTKALVELLLPEDWFRALSLIRSPAGELDGEVFEWQLFSSMGNASTFELESLIFWALAKASCAEKKALVSVYGDDVIVERSDALAVIATFEALGFRVNKEKSFISGRFFESCGKHYFDGVDVTPMYQKEEVGTLHQVLRAHNRLMRWAIRIGTSTTLHRVPKGAINWLRKKLPSELSAPLGYEGDDAWLFESHSGKQFLSNRRVLRVVQASPSDVPIKLAWVRSRTFKVKPVGGYWRWLFFAFCRDSTRHDRLSYLDAEPLITSEITVETGKIELRETTVRCSDGWIVRTWA